MADEKKTDTKEEMKEPRKVEEAKAEVEQDEKTEKKVKAEIKKEAAEKPNEETKPAKKETKKKASKGKKEQPAAKVEKIYTIPLRDSFEVPRSRRASAAMKVVKAFLVKNTKDANVKLDNSIGKAVWSRSMRKPPRRIRVKVTKEDEVLRASIVQ
jgi:large subunit ribosomal protein L31e